MTSRNEHRETLEALRAIATARNLPFITVARCFLGAVLDEYKRTGSLAELEKPNPEWIARV